MNVLVVEDNKDVRTAIADVLSIRGYRVIAAADGQEARQLSAPLKGTLDLIISDFVLPDIEGRQLYEQIAEQNPQCKALIISGYPDVSEERATRQLEGARFLRKPFSAPELMAHLQHLQAQVGSAPMM